MILLWVKIVICVIYSSIIAQVVNIQHSTSKCTNGQLGLLCFTRRSKSYTWPHKRMYPLWLFEYNTKCKATYNEHWACTPCIRTGGDNSESFFLLLFGPTGTIFGVDWK